MKIEGIFVVFLLFNVKLALSLKCYLTGYPWPRECSFLIHERHGTSPACLSAEVLDEYNNPTEIRQCSKVGSREMPGGCELLHKKRTVTKCALCEEDYCNNLENKNEARQVRPVLMVLLGIAAVMRLT